jgi:hypothetical protein
MRDDKSAASRRAFWQSCYVAALGPCVASAIARNLEPRAGAKMAIDVAEAALDVMEKSDECGWGPLSKEIRVSNDLTFEHERDLDSNGRHRIVVMKTVPGTPRRICLACSETVHRSAIATLEFEGIVYRAATNYWDGVLPTNVVFTCCEV